MDRQRTLKELIGAIEVEAVEGDVDRAVHRTLRVTGVTHDSRQVTPGAVFVAIQGMGSDGHRYIPQAVAAGAAAVVVEASHANVAVPAGVVRIVVRDGRVALAPLAAAFHGFPARKLTVIGVTGTDGKTTTSTFIHAILTAAGRRTGLVTSVSARIGDTEQDTGFHTTTPEAPAVQSYLAQMVDAGAQYAVLESTSHGLAQRRLDACEFDVAVVTNITHEHLDYHGSYEAYRAAKAHLFEFLSTSVRKPGVDKVAVLNADDASFAYLQPIPADRQIVYGIDKPAAINAHAIELRADGVRFAAVTPTDEFPVTVHIPGRFNVSNALAAIAATYALGVPLEAMQAGLASVPGVLGRMERIDEGQDFLAIVDFAHTPGALEHALTEARALIADTGGRLISVFGCAGLRDVAKRAWMGEISGRLADLTVITAEDPRTEDLDVIMEEIAAGCRRTGQHEGEGYAKVGDRAAAIAYAVNVARPGDLVISCGKGHERSMCYGTVETPWNEQEAMRAALRARLR
jgi:UDP-N-acetylmuramoyl-L-alanyl-D-glutamate--2,6-diaminopimelate ligase